MSKPILFLSIANVMDIHNRMIQEYGGDPEIRDPGLLESAVVMPTAQFDGHYLHESIAEMAAAYLFHICSNHPFVDGNKRTGLAAALTFLYANGKNLTASNKELEILTMDVADGSLTKQNVLDFFQDKVS